MMNPPDHTRFVVGCVTAIAIITAICGAWLLWKGFAGGGECIMTANTAVGGLIGFLSSRGRQVSPPSTTTAISSPDGTVGVTTGTLPENTESKTNP